MESPLKPEGWFSRRHQDSDANFIARSSWSATKSKAAKRQMAKRRQEERGKRGDGAQLTKLFKNGHDAVKERTRLVFKIMREEDAMASLVHVEELRKVSKEKRRRG
jgi:hypothetical protein